MSGAKTAAHPERGLLGGAVRWAAAHPFVGIAIVALGLTDASLSAGDLPRDVFPDLTTPIFNVIVQAPAMGTEEIERRVAIPLERAMAGLPNLRRVRSVCQAGVVQTTVELDPDADYYRARQLVGERVTLARAVLPEGLEPPLVSGVSARLNEVIELIVESEADGDEARLRIRDFAEVDLRRRILAVPGVGGFDVVGGELRQVQVRVDLDRMRARGVTLHEIEEATAGASASSSAGISPEGEIEWAVEIDGLATGAADLGATVVASPGGVPVLLRDVADVVEDGAFRRGSAFHRGREVVHVRIVKQVGADAVHVSRGVRAVLDALVVPDDLSVTVTYDQAELIDGALGGVGRAVGLGAIFVVLVILLLLGDLRAAVVVALAIPTSVALAIVALGRLGAGLDTMTLGGLAIAVGLLVDASIIVVENAAHRLAERRPGTRAHVVTEAAAEMARPITFATLVVIAVFVPLFGIAGVEGRMYGALALSVIAAMTASLFIALGVTPAVAGLAMRAPKGETTEHGWLVRLIEKTYGPVLEFALRHTRLVQIGALVVTAIAIALGARVGADFVPHLDEGYLMLESGVAPEATLATTDALLGGVEAAAWAVPEVVNVTRRAGRAEATEDPMPHTNGDILVELSDDRSRTDEEIADDLRERLSSAPGTATLFTTPLAMRIDEGLGGTPADISVRVYGTDLGALARTAMMLRDRMRAIEGLADVRTDVAGESPQLHVHLDRDTLVRMGAAPGEVTRAVRLAMVGEMVGPIYRDGRAIDVVVRVGAPGEVAPSTLRELPIVIDGGARVPLRTLGDVERTVGPSLVRRDMGSRRIAVEASVVGRDLGGAAADVRALVRDVTPDLADGTFAEVGGRVETQEAATRGLLEAVALAIVLVLVLVYVALGSLRDTLVIVGALPSALVGGIAALLVSGETWNVSSLVGLLGLLGIAVQNGLVLVSQTREAEARGAPFATALHEACLGRVRPKLMTAATAILGLVPLVVLPLEGVELERPLAIVMIGGLVTSTIFTLVVLPTVYRDAVRLSARFTGRAS